MPYGQQNGTQNWTKDESERRKSAGYKELKFMMNMDRQVKSKPGQSLKELDMSTAEKISDRVRGR